MRGLTSAERVAPLKLTGARIGINGDRLRETAKSLDRPIYYISGTPSMVVGTYRLLEGLGISDADIEVEAFRGYG